MAITPLHRAYYLLGLRRTQAKHERNMLAAELEALTELVDTKLRALKNETARMYMIEAAIESERDEVRRLH